MAGQSVNKHRQPAEEEEETVRRIANDTSKDNKKTNNLKLTMCCQWRVESSVDMDSNHKTIDNKIQPTA